MTSAQDRVYQAVVTWYRTHQVGPSLEALRDALGVQSLGPLSIHIRALIREGKLRREGLRGPLQVVVQTPTCPCCGQVVQNRSGDGR